MGIIGIVLNDAPACTSNVMKEHKSRTVKVTQPKGFLILVCCNKYCA